MPRPYVGSPKPQTATRKPRREPPTRRIQKNGALNVGAAISNQLSRVTQLARPVATSLSAPDSKYA